MINLNFKINCSGIKTFLTAGVGFILEGFVLLVLTLGGTVDSLLLLGLAGRDGAGTFLFSFNTDFFLSFPIFSSNFFNLNSSSSIWTARKGENKITFYNIL